MKEELQQLINEYKCLFLKQKEFNKKYKEYPIELLSELKGQISSFETKDYIFKELVLEDDVVEIGYKFNDDNDELEDDDYYVGFISTNDFIKYIKNTK